MTTVSLDEETAKKVLRQVEFYFSDSNLPRDNFLKKTINESEDGMVNLALICSFSRMKSHLSLGNAKPEDVSEDVVKAVADVLRKSAFLKVSEDGKTVGRTTELLKPEEVIEQVDIRTIAAEPLAYDVKHEDAESFFGQCGKEMTSIAEGEETSQGTGEVGIPTPDAIADPIAGGATQIKEFMGALGNLASAVQRQADRVDQATQTAEGRNRRRKRETEEDCDDDLRVLKNFKKFCKKEFKGDSTDPAIATWWIRDMEKACDAIRCTDSQKVMCATYMLISGADAWWRTTKPILLAAHGEITWTIFKEEFDRKYFPPHVKTQKISEFINLKQGLMSVSEYERKFEELSKYAPHMISTEEMKAQHFERGFRADIQRSVGVLQLKTCTDLVHCSQIFEGIEKAEEQGKEEKKGDDRWPFKFGGFKNKFGKGLGKKSQGKQPEEYN